MPFPLIPLAIGAAQALPKFFAAIGQKRKANKVQLQDTTPGAFREQLAGLRLEANTARMPGMGAAENKLAQNFAAGAAATTRAGGSSADALAGISALSLQRQQGQAALTTQGLQYQDLAKQRLNAGLSQQAAYQQRDQDNYNREKAALLQSSNQNLQNGIDGVANFAALGLNLQAGQGQPDYDTGYDPSLSPATPTLQGGLGNLSLPKTLPYYNPPAASGVGLSNYGRVRRRQRAIGV